MARVFEAIFKNRQIDTDIEGVIKRQRGEALQYVRTLFPDVVQSDIRDRDIDGILNAKRHAEDCASCTDPALCGHSRAAYVVRIETEPDGVRRIITGAIPCSVIASDPDSEREKKLFAESGLPRRATFAAFDVMNNIELRAAKGLAQRCAREGLSMVIGGPVGCGKTHLATAVAMDRISNGFSVAFYSSPDLFEQMRRDISADRTDTIDKVRGCDLLIIDDVGAERMKKNKAESSVEWTEERLFMIIDHRYMNRKPIILTTNAQNMGELRGMFGALSARICSRLGEMCKILWLKNVTDYRAIIAEREGI